MTVSATSLNQIQQTLGEMQNAQSTNTTIMTTAQKNLFALTLAAASNDLANAQTLSTTNGDSTFSSGVSGATGALGTSGSSLATTGTDNMLNLIALLTGITPGSSVASATPIAAPIEASPVSSGVTGSDVVNGATKFVGTPYVWGGTTPSGFDCSGFTQYVYGQLGVQIPRTSEEQATIGTPVSSLANAQPGDLLFFAGSDGTASSPGHVGIYVGNGQMIDAPYTGTTVQVQSLASAGPIVAIRHVLPTNSGPTMMGNVKVPAAYVPTILQAASANKIPASLLAAVLSEESGFNPSAVSSAGAQGIAQFMPATAAGMGINPLDPTQAINGAAKLLGAYTQRFGSYADALAAYNAGSSTVAKYGGIPPYPETEAYVPAVLSLAGLSGSGVVPA
jgi:cell wall-associated NlpC family hydrolase